MKFYARVWCSKQNKWFNCGGDPDHHADCQLDIQLLLKKLCADFDEIFRIALQ